MQQPLNQQSEPPQRPVASGIAIFAGFVAALMRVIPHPPNFSGVGALGLFGGAKLSGWQAYLYPLGIMALSDLGLWAITGLDPQYSPWHVSRAYVYSSFMVYVLIGRWLISENASTMRIASAAFLGGLQFFVFTNFCAWLFQPYEPGILVPYTRDFAGLTKCFAMAVPFAPQDSAFIPAPFVLVSNFPGGFLLWTCVGDVLFTVAYVAIYARMTQPQSDTTPAVAPAGQ
ncbi:MAG: hypothetical protein EXS16_02365 [Gemmataceae bacterium]|nr:hypothetical protein [Gemmataceae bacterium]